MALFRKKPPAPTPLEQLPEELQRLIAEATDERSKISSLLGRTRGSMEKVEKLDAPLQATLSRMDEMAAKVTQLEERTGQLQALAGRIEELGQRTAAAGQAQATAQAQVAKLATDMGDLQALASGLRESVSAAMQLKTELGGVMAPGGPVADIRGKVEQLREQFLTYAHDVTQARDQQDALRRAQEEALARATQARDEGARVRAQVDEAGALIAKWDATLANLAKVQQLAPRAEQDVQALNALADHVAHKTRILEKQREVVDRAAAQAARLDDLVWDLDARLKKLQQDSKSIKKTQDALEDLQDLVRRVEARTAEVRTAQQTAEKDSAVQATRMAGIRDEIKSSLDRFDIEKRGLDAVNQRIADLRMGLADFERRFHELQGTGQAISQAQARADELSARLATIASDVMRVSEQGERARNMEIVLERSDAATQRLAQRVETLQASYPDLQQLARDVGDLKSARETVLDALDRVRAARAELERTQAAQVETRTFLSHVDATVASLRQKFAGVEERTAAVERVGQLADAALSSQRELESRREFVDQLERRVAQLGALSNDLEQRARALEERRTGFADLESRADGLRGRLDDADRRFESVGNRAAEAAQVETRVTQVAAQAQAAEERVAGLARGVEDAAAREARVEELAARIDRTGRELEQRERALQQSSEHLERAATLRQSAMEAAQALEEQNRKLAGSLAASEGQTDRVAQLTEQLEARAGGLRLVEKRLTQFEEKLAQLERAEQNVERAVEGLAARQKSVDAVRDELSRIFELTEHTMEDVRAISTARQDVHTTRVSLDEVLQRATRVDQMAAGIDRRQREIELAEQRIARLDALLVDVRASLEALQVQKATIDHVLDKASQLTFLAKEAEALITTLREERDLTAKVHEGWKTLRDEDKQAQAG
ncbi:MAG: hypothetical protein HY560_01030 [Gemmatimonadetes bacterium]|nr:hypothetical protein [Gemmatimonadota bacterium]